MWNEEGKPWFSKEDTKTEEEHKQDRIDTK